ncbi:protein misato-like 1-like [Melia azedarach]|uniref:Protein misato-like 1-like n=1 Tax=Melia azedarach TaxID=155640 RepID=A0ACC1XVK3_MELAZ|nr:protein misato-like 1-like [Melia azedarach]
MHLNLIKRILLLQSLYEEEQQSFSMMNGTNSGINDSLREIQDKDIVECLNNGVKFWTDFSKVHYHPQSLYELSGLWMDVQDFDNYEIGKDSFSESFQGEEMCERLRFFVEECDHIQLDGLYFLDMVSPFRISFMMTWSIFESCECNDYIDAKDDALIQRFLCCSCRVFGEYCRFLGILYVVCPDLSFMWTNFMLTILKIKLQHSFTLKMISLTTLVLFMLLPYTRQLFLSEMEPDGPTAASFYVSGAVDVNGFVQMLSGQARQNSVAILDVAMPAPALNGKQGEQSVVGSLQPLTPEVAEDVDDFQAVESMIVHGALGSGILESVHF